MHHRKKNKPLELAKKKAKVFAPKESPALLLEIPNAVNLGGGVQGSGFSTLAGLGGVCVCRLRATPLAYGGSQARGAAGLNHSHGNAKSLTH